MNPTDPPAAAATAPLSRLRAWWSRLVAGLALATVAAVAGIVSYTHIDALTLALHGSSMSGHLMPFGIDGLIVVGSVVLLTVQGGQARWGWLCIVPGVAASLFANFESGIAHGYLAAGWATMPALSFAVATFASERWAKAQFGHGGRGGQQEEVSNDTVVTEAGARTCPHMLPCSAAESAVYAFLHARDCLNEPLSQRQIAAMFEMSRQRVAELVEPHLANAPASALNGSAP